MKSLKYFFSVRTIPTLLSHTLISSIYGVACPSQNGRDKAQHIAMTGSQSKNNYVHANFSSVRPHLKTIFTIIAVYFLIYTYHFQDDQPLGKICYISLGLDFVEDSIRSQYIYYSYLE